ncbi:acetyl-CoA synthetase [Halohasta salina]|uniref:acetyl-CoA synthetase n=1 Tax=Halohasta salina TaxID=2961621 RepID=UPI0020A5FB58|nr:acetyl-CoA synthetase [Halohasta salina]
MDAAVLGDLLGRDERRSQSAVAVPAVDRAMSYHDFITTAYKSGNALRYLGLSSNARLAVDPALRPEPLLAFLGAAQLGAATTFDPTAEARVRLVAVDDEADYESLEGRLAVFGGPPEATATTHWEQEVWSENPAFPPTSVDPEATVLVDGDDEYSHRRLLEMAEAVIKELSLTQGSRLAIRTPLSRPETIGGGLLAALAAGATAVFADDPTTPVDAEAALVAAASDEPPEPSVYAVDALSP